MSWKTRKAPKQGRLSKRALRSPRRELRRLVAAGPRAPALLAQSGVVDLRGVHHTRARRARVGLHEERGNGPAQVGADERQDRKRVVELLRGKLLDKM